MIETFDIAGYCRISVDEELDRDNTSIENQKAIIEDFVKEKFPGSSLTFFEDRDRSGYTFEQREGYQKLRKGLLNHTYDILVVVGEIDPVPDGDDAHPGVAQILQLPQTLAVAAGETGEILDHQNVVCVIEQSPAQLLISFPLLKGVAGAVAVFKECQAAAGKFFFDKVLDDRLLVLNRGVVPVQLFVYGDSAVTGNVKGLYHKLPILSIFIY